MATTQMAHVIKGIDRFSKKFAYSDYGQPLGEFLKLTFILTTELLFSIYQEFKIPSIFGRPFLKGLVFRKGDGGVYSTKQRLGKDLSTKIQPLIFFYCN